MEDIRKAKETEKVKGGRGEEMVRELKRFGNRNE